MRLKFGLVMATEQAGLQRVEAVAHRGPSPPRHGGQGALCCPILLHCLQSKSRIADQPSDRCGSVPRAPHRGCLQGSEWAEQAWSAGQQCRQGDRSNRLRAPPAPRSAQDPSRRELVQPAAPMALVLALNGVSLRLDPGSVSLDDLLRALRADGGAPAAAWLAAAHHLLACGRERDFEAVLSEAAEREPAPGSPPAVVFPHVQALCSLAEFSAQQAAGERERRRRQELLMRATDLCHRAQRLSLEEQLPELVLGHVALVKVRWGLRQAVGGLVSAS